MDLRWGLFHQLITGSTLNDQPMAVLNIERKLRSAVRRNIHPWTTQTPLRWVKSHVWDLHCHISPWHSHIRRFDSCPSAPNSPPRESKKQLQNTASQGVWSCRAWLFRCFCCHGGPLSHIVNPKWSKHHASHINSYEKWIDDHPQMGKSCEK